MRYCVLRYLARDYLGAYMLYAQAAELGYDVAQANAAYLLDKGLVDIRALVGAPTGGPVDPPAGGKVMDVDQAYAKLLGWAREALSLRLHWLAYARGGVAEAAVAIGDAYFFGRGGTCGLIAAAALSHMLSMSVERGIERLLSTFFNVCRADQRPHAGELLVLPCRGSRRHTRYDPADARAKSQQLFHS